VNKKSRKPFHLRIFFLCGFAFFLIAHPSLSAPHGSGIEGKAAAPLTAQSWVDANGKPGMPVDIAALKGRVVYLLFFQDW